MPQRPFFCRFASGCPAPTLLLLLVLALGTGCQRWADRPAAALAEMQEAAGPTQESWDVTFAVTNDGLPRMVLEAGYMAEFVREDSTYLLLQAAETATPGRVVAYLFDAAGDSSATVTANRMRYYERDQRVEATGQVVVEAREGRRLEGEHLIWLEREREIRTPGFVRITTAREQIQGYDLEADESLETYTLYRVTATRTLDEDA